MTSRERPQAALEHRPTDRPPIELGISPEARALSGGGFSLRTTGGHAGTIAAKSRERMLMILERIEAYVDAALEARG